MLGVGNENISWKSCVKRVVRMHVSRVKSTNLGWFEYYSPKRYNRDSVEFSQWKTSISAIIGSTI